MLLPGERLAEYQQYTYTQKQAFARAHQQTLTRSK